MPEHREMAPDGGLTGASAPAKGKRLFFVDNLRVALTILVVLHHSALSFMGADTTTTGVLTALTLINQAYFMGLFFLISGYFVPRSLRRKGTLPFLRDRLLRLLLPLVGYVVLLSPLTALDVNSDADLTGPVWRVYLDNLSVGALWFLEVLLVLTIGYALVVGVIGRLVFPCHERESMTRRSFPSALQITGLIIAIAALTFVVRTVLPFGAGVGNLPTPSHIPQYLVMFVVGTIAYRGDWFRQVPRRAAVGGFSLAGVATLVLVPLALVNSPAFMGGSWHWSAFAYALWESSLCVGLTIGLLAWFRRRFDHQGRFGAYLSRHAFTVFLLHLPVIACLTLLVDRLPNIPFLGFGVGAIAAVAISFALAGPVRSLPLLRNFL